MNVYKVGQIINRFKNHSECVQFDMADDGAVLEVFFQSPTHDEKAQFESGKSFEIRYTELDEVIMLTVKIGNLNWMDAPYTPHLSKNLSKFAIPQEGQGLGLILILIDATTGKIEHMRQLGLSTDFSQRLIGLIMEQKVKEFDADEYYKNIRRIYDLYTTDQIVEISKDCCKIN